MFSSNSTTFFVTLPSNVKDYAENKPNRFRVHMPKRIELNGNWMCALQSIQFPYSWPASIGIENGQWIDVHLKNANETGSSVLHITVPEVISHSPEELIAFLNDLLNEHINKASSKSRKRRSPQENVGAPKSKAHKIIDRLAAGRQRAPSPPAPLERENTRTVQNEARIEVEEGIAQQNESQKAADGLSQTKSIAHKILDKISENRTRAPSPPLPISAPIPVTSSAQQPLATTPTPPQASLPVLSTAQTASTQTVPQATIPGPKAQTTTHQVAVTQATSSSQSIQAPESPKTQNDGTPVSQKGKEKQRASSPPPPPTPNEEKGRSIAHKIIDKLVGRDETQPSTAVERYEEPKSQERGIIKEFFDTLTYDLSGDELRVSEQQIKALVAEHTFKQIEGKAHEISPETKAVKEKEEVRVRAPSPPKPKEQEKEELKSLAHKLLDKLGQKKEREEAEAKEEIIKEPTPNQERLYFVLDEDKIKLIITHNNISHLSISTQLSHVLGDFYAASRLTNGAKAQKVSDLSKGITAFAVCAKGLTEQMILGNKTSSLLRIVSIDGHHKPGMMIDRIYDTPMFMRVMPREINEIEIEIFTLHGQYVPFVFGTVIVTLIFKKVINI
jgi:hypothetical protein